MKNGNMSNQNRTTPVFIGFPKNNHLLHIKGAWIYVSMNLALGVAKMEEDDLMQNTKKIIKLVITVYSTLVISTGLQASITPGSTFEYANHKFEYDKFLIVESCGRIFV